MIKKMTKADFFKMRDELRAGGELQDYQPENYENDLLADEEKRALEALGNQKSGVYRTIDVGLTGLLCVEVYIGKQVKVRRNRVDEIDNVTIWRI
jgi:hypothetical protein